MKRTLKQKVSFKKHVFEVVRKIPKGKTLSYGDVAKMAGNFRAGRAVGAILHTNFDPTVPCHRVVRSDGKLGGYNRGISLKRKLLLNEI